VPSSARVVTLTLKMNVKSDADPLFKYLKKSQMGIMGSEKIKWNFTRFLINRDGKVIARFAPTVKPKDLEKDIESLLEE